ncbi:glycosyltransferase family 87 protein [Bacteroidota bacterium]
MIKKKNFHLKNWNTYFGLIILAAICILFMFAEIINNRFWLSDFEVYYKAAVRILNSKNLYQIIEFDHYQFKYSPSFAIFFIPFTIVPFAIAKYLYWLFLTSIIVIGYYLCVIILKPSMFDHQKIKSINIIFLLAFLILAIHLLRELHLGQVNYLLLFLYILAIYCLKKHKRIGFSLIIAVSIFIKPFALIFIPFMIIKKKYFELLLFACFCTVLFLLPLIFYGSIETTINQYQMWFNELRIELSHKQGLLENANFTIFSVFARYTPIRFLLINSKISFIYQIIMLILIGIAFIWFTKINSNNINSEQKNYFSFIEFALLISFIPLLAYTSVNAFIFVQLLVFIVLLYFKSLRNYEMVLAIIAFLFIGGNYVELIGLELSIKLDDISVLTFGIIILIYLLYVMRSRNILKVKE